MEDLQADLLVLLLEAVDLGLQSFVLLLHGAQLHAGGQNSTRFSMLCEVNPLNGILKPFLLHIFYDKA